MLIEFDLLSSAFVTMFWGEGIAYLMFGVLIGMLFGLVPGLGGTTALALLIPLGWALNPLDAMYLAGGVMGATSFAGSITAILLNTPGTAPNAATAFDGYPLACQGKAGFAIGASAAASALGGLLGILSLLVVIPLARGVVLAFGPAELLLLAFLGLIAVAVATGGSLVRSMIAGGIGLFLALVGADPLTGTPRLTLGIDSLWDGIGLVPALIGMFAIAQMLELAARRGKVSGHAHKAAKDARPINGVGKGILAAVYHWPTLILSSMIGTIIGAIPGLGGTVAAFLTYGTAARIDRDPGSFGTGNIRGVIAPEASNNAKDGGSLIPTLALGIPGSAETSLFLAFLIMHGLTPGPQLLENRGEIYGLVAALTVSALLASAIGLMLARWFVRVPDLDAGVLAPVVIVMALAGVFALNGQIWDVVIALGMGCLGMALTRLGYPRLPLVMAFVLGDMAERSYHQLHAIANDDWFGYFSGRPISLLLAGLLLMIVIVFLRRKNSIAV